MGLASVGLRGRRAIADGRDRSNAKHGRTSCNLRNTRANCCKERLGYWSTYYLTDRTHGK